MPTRFTHVKLDEFVIMPDHVHGIIVLEEVGAGLPRPPGGAAAQKGAETAPVRTTLGQVVAYFKYQTSKKFNVQRGKPGQRVWQRNYYEHIIRNEDDLRRTREYIRNNPDARAFNTIGRQT